MVKCVDAAATIMDHLIQQKLIMMDLTEVPEGHTANNCATTYIPHAVHLRKLLLLSAEDHDGTISLSSVTRGHISEPTMGKYKIDKALELFGVAHTYGFGSTVEQTTPPKRKVKKFRKTPYELLSADARSMLREIRVTEDEYRFSFTPKPTSCCTEVPENSAINETNKENASPSPTE